MSSLGYSTGDEDERVESRYRERNSSRRYSSTHVNRLTSHLASSYGYQSGQFNRLITATTPTGDLTYSHDANGNTTTKSDGSNLWRYTWDHVHFGFWILDFEWEGMAFSLDQH